MAKKDKDPGQKEVEITGSTADTHKVPRMTVYHDMLGGLMDRVLDMDKEIGVIRERVIKLEKIHSSQMRIERIKRRGLYFYLFWVFILLSFLSACAIGYYSEIWRNYI